MINPPNSIHTVIQLDTTANKDMLLVFITRCVPYKLAEKQED
jgi:hypothetical protein